MTENSTSEFVAPDLMNKMEEAAVSAARDILTGRRIIDVDGPYGLGLTTLRWATMISADSQAPKRQARCSVTLCPYR